MSHCVSVVSSAIVFPLKCLCTLHSFASNESSDCNIFSGATHSSVKSSDCVTNFPVEGGIAVDCVPLLRMWFSGLIQYKQRELEGGSLVVELPQAQPRMRFSRERYQTARLKFFTWLKTIICLYPTFCSYFSERERFHQNQKLKWWMFMLWVTVNIKYRHTFVRITGVFGVLCRTKSFVWGRIFFFSSTLDSISLLLKKMACCPVFKEASVLLLGLILGELFSKHTRPQWKCRLINLVLLTRSGGYVVEEPRWHHGWPLVLWKPMFSPTLKHAASSLISAHPYKSYFRLCVCQICCHFLQCWGELRW